MVKIAELMPLQPGDVVETGTILEGLSHEPVRLEILRVSGVWGDETRVIDVRATYFGILVGNWTATVVHGRAIWAKTTPTQVAEVVS